MRHHRSSDGTTTHFFFSFYTVMYQCNSCKKHISYDRVYPQPFFPCFLYGWRHYQGQFPSLTSATTCKGKHVTYLQEVNFFKSMHSWPPTLLSSIRKASPASRKWEILPGPGECHSTGCWKGVIPIQPLAFWFVRGKAQKKFATLYLLFVSKRQFINHGIEWKHECFSISTFESIGQPRLDQAT